MASAEGTEAAHNGEIQMNREQIMAELNEKGYCVIPNILTSEECDAHIASYRDWLSQFQKDDFPFQRHSIIQSYRIGHFQATWEIRLSAKKVFETVWQTKKLLTSFDAVAISPPPEEDDGKGFTTPGSTWLHLDQSAKRWGLHGYQGAVYLEETSETDYCFRVLEGSHAHTDDFYRQNPDEAASSNKMNYFKLQDSHITWFEQHGCRLKKVPVPKGGVVLWDSRIVHDNSRPEPGRPNTDRWRFVVFVCMAPASWASLADLSKKRQAYKKLLMTTHWPCQDVSFFPERMSDALCGVEMLKKLPEAARRKEAQRLAGVVEYDFEDGEPNGPAWEPSWQE